MAELQNRDRLERRFARGLQRLQEEKRRELLNLVGDPPDLSAVPPSFWADFEQQAEERMAEIMLFVWIAAATQTGASRGKAQETGSVFVRNAATEGSRLFAQKARQRWERFVGRVAQGRARPGQAPGQARSIFGPQRTESAVRTQTTRVAQQAVVQTAESPSEPTKTDDGDVVSADGKNFELIWRLDPGCNHCRFCPAISNTRKECWGQLIDSPPAHPHCCCWIEVAPAGSAIGVRRCPPITRLRSLARDDCPFCRR